jgi:ribose/xylose/arabinose/galactoside ABC-type transport system permease subunit
MVKKPSYKLLKSVLGLGVRYIVAILYEVALASLLPLFGLLLTPGFQLDSNFIQAIGIAFAFVIGGFLVLLLYKKRIDSALVSLGLMTLFPGVLALVLSYYHGEALLRWVGSIYGVKLLEPVLASYLQSALPKVYILVLVYILVGAFLVAWGLHFRQIYKPSKE